MPTQPPARAQARRAVWAGLLRALLTTTGLVWLYFDAPLERSESRSALVLLAVGLVVVGALLTWQVRAIVSSSRPRLRAVEALAAVVPLFLLLFALFYYLLTQNDPRAFSQPLTRLDALYFTITTFSTVGYGDVVAVSGTARVGVMTQMLLDVALIGAGLRVLLKAVQVGLARQGDDPAGDADDPAGDA